MTMWQLSTVSRCPTLLRVTKQWTTFDLVTTGWAASQFSISSLLCQYKCISFSLDACPWRTKWGPVLRGPGVHTVSRGQVYTQSRSQSQGHTAQHNRALRLRVARTDESGMMILEDVKLVRSEASVETNLMMWRKTENSNNLKNSS